MNEKRRKIIAITGARSEYDLLFSVYEKLHNDPDIEFGLIVTGPHLSEKFGRTSLQIVEDDLTIIDNIYNLIDSDLPIARITSIGNQIPLLAQTLNREKPDLVLIAGDREEAITTTVVCAYLGLACAHFFGGDIAKDGNVDNSIRYASSKLATFHFVTLEEHKKTLVRLGEIPENIFVVGNPALDRFVNCPKADINTIQSKIRGNMKSWDNYCVLIQHSIITEIEQQYNNIRITLDAILESNIPCFINYPNSDVGYSEIINAYEHYCELYPEMFVSFKNLDRISYVNLLRNAKFLIGNSSSGLLEAPSIKLPAVNVGSRQRGRVHAENVIFTDYDKEEIISAINKIKYDLEFQSQMKSINNPYGNGNSAQTILEIIKNININKEIIHKNITY